MAASRDIVRLSSKGQIVIPAKVRRRLGLVTGQALSVNVNQDDAIVLKPAPAEMDIEAARDAMHRFCLEHNLDPVEDLHQRRAKERREEAKRRERWGH